MKNRIPYVLSIDSDVENWINEFSWPVDPLTGLKVNERVLARFTHIIEQLSGEARDIVLLARGINEAATLIEAAIVASSSESALLESPVIAAINARSVGRFDLTQHLKRMGDRFRIKKIPFAKVRQLIRVLSWSGLPGLVPSLLQKDGVSITHNALLVSEIKRQRYRVGYKHAEPWFQDILETFQASTDTCSLNDLDELSCRLATALLDDEFLEPELKQFLVAILQPYCFNLVSAAAKSLDGLKHSTLLPNVLWSGNGSFYASRAIGIEVMRRGGVVRRFDHGGTASLLDNKDYLIQQELAVSTDFVLPSRLAATLPVINDAASAQALSQPVNILCGGGDPSLKPNDAFYKKTASVQPRVLLIGTAYYGFYQSFPPFLPGPVYLDWQKRLIETLGSFNISLSFKPHPGGLYMGCPRPLLGKTRVETRSFEECFVDYDLLVFDFAGSTTFSVALSSQKPIVLLDFGSLKFQESVRGRLYERCDVINVAVDHRNRVVIDVQELRDAIFTPRISVDPSYFRELFLDDTG